MQFNIEYWSDMKYAWGNFDIDYSIRVAFKNKNRYILVFTFNSFFVRDYFYTFFITSE